MENPCKECKLSQAEKTACCGCPQRLKYEKENMNFFGQRKTPVRDAMVNSGKTIKKGHDKSV